MVSPNITVDKHRYKTTFMLQPEKKRREMKDVLECIFWRNPELAVPALEFLEILKESRVEDSIWSDFCEKKGITRGQYDSIIKKLRGSGLIYKRDRYWKLSDDFEKFLEKIVKITYDWKGDEE